MKQIAIIFLMLMSAGWAYSQQTNPNYDEVLAKKLGSDDYGMKKYVFVILKTGENTTTDKHFVDSCFKGHMANIDKMVKDGKLLVAGPFSKNEHQFRGLFIINESDVEKAKALVATDPAVNAKLLSAECFSWYGSAALPVYLEASEKIWKKGF